MSYDDQDNSESTVNPAFALDTAVTRQIVTTYAGGLVQEMATVDPDMLEHELGTAQLAVAMLPDSLHTGTLHYKGKDLATFAVGVTVAVGLHDTGKTRWDLQRLEDVGDFGPRVRSWVREEHCTRGAARIAEFARELQLLQRLGTTNVLGRELMENLDVQAITPEQLLILNVAAFIAAHHHSSPPDNYTKLHPDQSLLWGLASLTKFADVLHSLRYDHGHQRKYQEEREGLKKTRPNEVILDIIWQECGMTNPIIAGVEVDMGSSLRRLLESGMQ